MFNGLTALSAQQGNIVPPDSRAC